VATVKNVISKLWNSSPHAVQIAFWSRVQRRNPSPRWVAVSSGPLKGGELFIDPGAFEGWKRMSEGKFDEFIYDVFDTIGEVDGKVVWDIGAHFGYHSLSFASLVGEGGRVFSFEPNPFNLIRLNKNIERNTRLSKRILVKDRALSDSKSEVEFSFSKNVDDSRSSGSHLVGVGTPLPSEFYESFETIRIKAETIDSLLEGKEILPADILKIDVEGAERLVLNGGRQFFSTFRPIVFMEVHNIVMMYYCLNYLRDLDYEVSVLDEADATLSKCFIVAKPKT